jgi:hypothetical protein
MKLYPVKHYGIGRTYYCGPSVLASITGSYVEHMEEAIKIIRNDRGAVKSVSNVEAIVTLKFYRFHVQELFVPYGWMVLHWHKKIPPETLNMLRVKTKNGYHLIAMTDTHIFDSIISPSPTLYKKYNKKEDYLVMEAWEIRKGSSAWGK